MSNLGHLLINGLGVVRDEAKAARLFRHSARLGAAEAPAEVRGPAPPPPPPRLAPAARTWGTCCGRRASTSRIAWRNPSSWPELRSTSSARRVRPPPWDAAPEHSLLLEPPKKTREDWRPAALVPSLRLTTDRQACGIQVRADVVAELPGRRLHLVVQRPEVVRVGPHAYRRRHRRPSRRSRRGAELRRGGVRTCNIRLVLTRTCNGALSNPPGAGPARWAAAPAADGPLRAHARTVRVCGRRWGGRSAT
mmetsp:Transcript_17744/g.62203  ORF Transcript_17744/g.62203 Transcript_17744/m.62203 type:complete len:250 (-) Transcript_17744:3-752(-)